VYLSKAQRHAVTFRTVYSAESACFKFLSLTCIFCLLSTNRGMKRYLLNPTFISAKSGIEASTYCIIKNKSRVNILRDFIKINDYFEGLVGKVELDI